MHKFSDTKLSQYFQCAKFFDQVYVLPTGVLVSCSYLPGKECDKKPKGCKFGTCSDNGQSTTLGSLWLEYYLDRHSGLPFIGV